MNVDTKITYKKVEIPSGGSKIISRRFFAETNFLNEEVEKFKN